MALVGYSPFANLTSAEVSQKKPSWSKNDKDTESVVGAQLEGASLRYASADGAFLAGANLFGADLRGADLSAADLRRARLFHAHLNRASLLGADLSGADLERADLQGAELLGADITHSDLQGAYNLNPWSVRTARNWDKAFYDYYALKLLGLPSDYNTKLGEQLQKEKERQEKQDTGQAVTKSTAPQPN
jgi:hypothetical protein